MNSHPFADHVAHHVRVRRDELKLTQKQVADAAKVSEPTVINIEAGRLSYKTQIGTLRKLDDGLQWPKKTVEKLAQGLEPPGTPGKSHQGLPTEVRAMLTQIELLRRLTRPVELPPDVHEALTELTDQAADMQLRLIEGMRD